MPCRNIGTSVVLLSSLTEEKKAQGYVIDFTIQNLSANNVFIGGSDVTASDYDVKLIANTGSFSNDRRQKELCVIADAADSQISFDIEIHPHDMKKKVYFNQPVMR